MIFKKTCLLLLLLPFSLSWAETTQKEKENTSGYNYIIDKFFTARPARTDYSYSKSVSLYGGLSFYRKNTTGQKFDPYSSLSLGIDQKIKELPYIGDISLQASLFSSKMENQGAVLLEVSPRVSFPSAYTGFPLYVGLGASFGFYPWYIIQKRPALSVSGQTFVGLRFFDLYQNMGMFVEFNLRISFPFKELNIYLEHFVNMGLIFRF